MEALATKGEASGCYFGDVRMDFFCACPPGEHLCRKWARKVCRKVCLDSAGVYGLPSGHFQEKSSPGVILSDSGVILEILWGTVGADVGTLGHPGRQAS